MPKPYRYAIVWIDPDLIASMIRSGAIITTHCIEGVPADAIFVDSKYDFESNGILMRFAHNSFPAMQEGCISPRVGVILDKVVLGGAD